ncbi:hypothetical protein DUI87_14912 [Hirundo rustica rustica]|uniref:Uncharacterized protein n=1 Tax=Hirundo rustica rustica TaxID=333673 RepID=A0A3M0KBI5_HIRRU|nr:hypothetical protein DUI87_14912 [Hirundo rustica rustica]
MQALASSIPSKEIFLVTHSLSQAKLSYAKETEQKFTPVLAEVSPALGVIATRNKICIRTTKASSNQTVKYRF